MEINTIVVLLVMSAMFNMLYWYFTCRGGCYIPKNEYYLVILAVLVPPFNIAITLILLYVLIEDSIVRLLSMR